MLLKCQVDEVLDLLAAGYSQREISRRTGVSRGTVSSLASGKRSAYYSDAVVERSQNPPTRFDWRPCPKCGGMRLPDRCVYCEAVAFDRRKRLSAKRP